MTRYAIIPLVIIMTEKIEAFIRRLEDIISDIDIEPIKNFLAKIPFDRLLQKDFSKRFITRAFLIIVALISAVSIAVVISEVKDDPTDDATFPGETTDVMQSATFAQATDEIKGNFLFLLNAEESKDVHLIAVARIDSAERTMNIAFLNKNSTCSANDFSGTLTEHYNYGGAKQLMWAVGQYTGISIERYLVGDEDSFQKFCNLMGDVHINIPERVSHNYEGLGYIIEKGEQNLTPSMFLRYFLYLCSKDLSENISNIMVLMGMTVFSAEDEEKLQKNVDAFSKYFDTNISAVDLGTYRAAICKMASTENPPTVTIETSFDKFKE